MRSGTSDTSEPVNNLRANEAAATELLSRRNLIQLALIVVVGLGIGRLLQQAQPIGQDVGENERAAEILLDKISPSQEVGNPTLTLVVFTDYQCAACKLAHPEMEAALADDAHVRVIYRDLPIFGAMSEQAARVAIAADWQQIYPAVHRGLMENRLPLSEAVMHDIIESAGGDWAILEQDLKTHANAIDRQIETNRRDAFMLGIAGTPAFLAGPILVRGAIDQTDFETLFAEARASNNR